MGGKGLGDRHADLSKQTQIVVHAKQNGLTAGEGEVDGERWMRW